MAKFNIKPLADRVLIEPMSREEKTKSGIVLPETLDKERPEQGKILAVGSGKPGKDGKLIKLGVKKGDVVLFSHFPLHSKDKTFTGAGLACEAKSTESNIGSGAVNQARGLCKKIIICDLSRRARLARMSGRIRSIEAQVVPMKLARTVPIASKSVLTKGVPANEPLI